MRKRTAKGLANEAWKLMSLYARQSRADYRGMVQCVTCKKWYYWKDVHAGHFIHGGRGGKRNPVSYDFRNIHPQCAACNYYGARGKACIRYTQFMLDTYGDGIVDELELIHRQPAFDVLKLEAKIAELKVSLATLEKAGD